MMTRREWLNRVVGAVAAAAVAPLVDLTDMTPAFWQQPALQAVLPWRIQFPDGLVWAFNAQVTAERVTPDGAVQLTLSPRGSSKMTREFSYPMNYVDDPVPGTCALPPDGWFCTLEAGHGGPCPTHERKFQAAVPVPAAHEGTLIVRDGVTIGELVDVTPPSLQRSPVEALRGDMDTHVLGMLKREPVTFTVEFK